MKDKRGSVAPSHGFCQSGRWAGWSETTVKCANRALPGKVYCQACMALAMARLPDRAIGDARGIKTHYGTTLSRGWE